MTSMLARHNPNTANPMFNTGPALYKYDPLNPPKWNHVPNHERIANYRDPYATGMYGTPKARAPLHKPPPPPPPRFSKPPPARQVIPEAIKLNRGKNGRVTGKNGQGFSRQVRDGFASNGVPLVANAHMNARGGGGPLRGGFRGCRGRFGRGGFNAGRDGFNGGFNPGFQHHNQHANGQQRGGFRGRSRGFMGGGKMIDTRTLKAQYDENGKEVPQMVDVFKDSRGNIVETYMYTNRDVAMRIIDEQGKLIETDKDGKRIPNIFYKSSDPETSDEAEVKSEPEKVVEPVKVEVVKEVKVIEKVKEPAAPVIDLTIPEPDELEDLCLLVKTLKTELKWMVFLEDADKIEILTAQIDTLELFILELPLSDIPKLFSGYRTVSATNSSQPTSSKKPIPHGQNPNAPADDPTARPGRKERRRIRCIDLPLLDMIEKDKLRRAGDAETWYIRLREIPPKMEGMERGEKARMVLYQHSWICCACKHKETYPSITCANPCGHVCCGGCKQAEETYQVPYFPVHDIEDPLDFECECIKCARMGQGACGGMGDIRGVLQD